MNQDELENKYKYPVIYFNEYFRRKPMRLAERECESLFTMDKVKENNFAYISLEDHQKEIEKRDGLLKEAESHIKMLYHEHNQAERDRQNWLKEYGELKNGK